MESSITTHQRNLAVITHLSVFSKYFIPFGNFIVPLILWSVNKQQSSFIDETGKKVLNFQLSLLLYGVVFVIISIPFALIFTGDLFHFIHLSEINDRHFDLDFGWHPFWMKGIIIGFAGLLILGFKIIFDVICVIIGAIKASNGEIFKYPLTINFIK